MLDATPPAPERERKVSETSDAETALHMTPSLECMVKNRVVCTGEGECADDVCEACAALNKEGEWGHFPWDELEMMKHGWMDSHGHHWGKVEPRDDLTLLQLGAINREGESTHKEISTAGHILRAKMSTDDLRQFMSGTVSFGGVTVTTIPNEEDEPSPKQSSSQTVITLCDTMDAVPAVHFDCYKVSGGEVTRVDAGNKKASLLKCPERLVFVERGGTEELLIAAEIDKETGRLSVKRLQQNR